MSGVPPVHPRKFAKYLKRNGFEKVGGLGGHAIYQSSDGWKLQVPAPGRKVHVPWVVIQKYADHFGKNVSEVIQEV